MNRLVLIDGNAILHRAYHALPPLTDPEGHVVNAVYGFTSMLFRIATDLVPTHIAVAFDRPAPTFRKELFKEYQAHRPKMDDDLIPQVEKVHDVVRSFGIPIFEMDGYEADDIIGTLCQHMSKVKSQKSKVQAKSQNDETTIDQVIIVTGDRDILQLVEDEKVFVYMPTKGLSEAKLYGEKEVVERMGVTPKQIPDFKALAGDASDNYPGVEGIGPKTAVTILEKLGTIENLYKEMDKDGSSFVKATAGKRDLGDNVIEKLKKGKEDALMSYMLATIKQDVPIEISLHPFTTFDTPEGREALSKLGFGSLIKRLDKLGKSSTDSHSDKETKKNEKEEDSNQQSLF